MDNIDTSYPQHTCQVTYYSVIFQICMLFMGLASVVGTATSIINSVVYYKQGLNHSVTISYFALSLWDCGSCFMAIILFVCHNTKQYFPISAINLSDFYYAYIGYIRGLLRALTTCATCYLSIEICFCIRTPLNVRVMFTKSRAILIHVTFVCVCTGSFCPVWAIQGLRWKHDPRFNRTRLMFWTDMDILLIYLFLSSMQ